MPGAKLDYRSVRPLRRAWVRSFNPAGELPAVAQ